MVNGTVSEQSVELYLDKIATLSVGPGEAATLARSILNSDKKHAERLFVSLRTAAWLLLAFHDRAALPEWFDMYRHVAAFMKSYDKVNHDRIRVLCDLFAQSIKFDDIHSDINDRGHAKAILRSLELFGSQTCRQVCAQTRIQPFNMIRITNSMAAAHLIRKRGYGEEAVLSLISAG